MKSYRILDGSFMHQKSATLGNDRSDEGPQHFLWSNDSDGEYEGGGEYTFFTDMCIDKSPAVSGKKVAWLIEPPSLSETHYHKTIEYLQEFDYVLSFWKPYLDRWFPLNGLFYPLGGSWIRPEDQGIHEKSRNVCIIVSQKTGAQGHRMRHEVVDFYANRFHIDFYGRGYRPFESKARVLWPYRYAIIIESWFGEDYFSEKLIDAISMGCVPIYCGCPNIKKYFNKSGIITFDNLHTLEHILTSVINAADYQMRLNAIKENYEICKQYQCAEDWIYNNHGFLFA